MTLCHLYFNHCIFSADVADDDGHSPLDLALKYRGGGQGQMSVALYLLDRGYGGDRDKARLLFKACNNGKMDVVKELFEELKVDPTGIELTYCTCPMPIV